MFVTSTGEGRAGSRQKLDVEPIAVSPKKACIVLDCGLSHLYRLMREGEIDFYKDSTSTKVIVKSMEAYVERLRKKAALGKGVPRAALSAS